MDSETVKIGSFWVEEYSNLLVVVKSLYGNSDGSNGVVYIVIDNQGNVSGRLSSEMGLFLSNNKRLYHASDLQLRYEDGFTQGYKDSCDNYYAHLKEGGSTIQKDIYNEGYLAGVMEMRGTERERVIREEAYDLGFMEALNTYGIELEDFELEPTSPYEFSASEDDEPEYDFTEEILKVLSGENKSVLRIPKRTNPNKETQEVMQEVVDKELDCTWAASDGTGRIKVLKITGNTCDVEVIELDDDGGYYSVGDTLTINVEDLKSHWTKVSNPTKEVKHSHYRKSVEGLDYIDIYRVCRLFGVEDNSHCLHHAIKKLLMSGKRGSKSKIKDITEARDSLNSYLSDEELFEGKGCD